MQLTNRLYMNISLCQPCNVLADVGCDHAYTDIYAVQNNIAKKAIAMDLRVGPLDKAKSNIKEAGLETQIETRLGDGLEALGDTEADAVLISGMGGITICKILDEGQEKLSGVKQLILQPQSDLGLVRKKLEHLKFCIENENMCIEDGKYYTCIRAVRSTDGNFNGLYGKAQNTCKGNIMIEAFNCIDDKDEDKKVFEQLIYDYGLLLLEEHNSILYEYLTMRLKKIEAIKEQIVSEAPSHICGEEKCIKKALGYFYQEKNND